MFSFKKTLRPTEPNDGWSKHFGESELKVGDTTKQDSVATLDFIILEMNLY